MDFAPSEYAQVVEAIHSTNFSADAAKLLKTMLVHDKASELMKQVVAFEQSHSKSSEDMVYGLLGKLEMLASSTQRVAGVLMARLWPYANELFLHDVCDAIDLWICECNSAELTEQLRMQVLSEQDAGVRRHYEGWIKGK